MLKLNEMHKSTKKKNSVFGTNIDINEQAALFIEETLNEQEN